jgi:integrase
MKPIQIGPLYIRPENLNGNPRFYVGGLLGSTRVQKIFKTATTAQDYCEREVRAFDTLGDQFLTLDHNERVKLMMARIRAEEKSYSICDALNFYEASLAGQELPAAIRPAKAKAKGPTVKEARKQFLADRVRIGVRKNTLTGYEQFTKKLLAPETKPVGSFTVGDIKTFLEQWANPTSYNGKLVMLRTFFGFCAKQDWIDSNPADRLDKKKVDKKRPFVLSSKSIEKLLASILEIRPEAIAYYALAIFAGIRDGEISRMTWDNINLAEGWITVDKAKTTSPRVIMLDDCGPLAEWLTYAKEIGASIPDPELKWPTRQLAKQGARSTFQLIYKDAGVEWKTDCLRHTFCSYHAEAFSDRALTSKIAGHSEKVGARFYDSTITEDGVLVNRTEALRLWELTPDKFNK